MRYATYNGVGLLSASAGGCSHVVTTCVAKVREHVFANMPNFSSIYAILDRLYPYEVITWQFSIRFGATIL